MKDFIEELTWRGMIHQMMPGTDELLKKEQTTAYLGIDPTADSLHIGHLCGVMMLRHFQRCGHKPLALVGGATGMIGDPSGKSQERNLLDEETLKHNVACIKEQLSRFLGTAYAHAAFSEAQVQNFIGASLLFKEGVFAYYTYIGCTVFNICGNIGTFG